MIICEIMFFDWYFFLNSAHLICRNADISKNFRGSLRLRDNESRLYILTDDKTSPVTIYMENGCSPGYRW